MKEKIINTAIQVFNAHGLSAVPMKQIAEELGISPGNLSYHFKSKEILLHAIRDRIAEEFAGSRFGLAVGLTRALQGSFDSGSGFGQQDQLRGIAVLLRSRLRSALDKIRMPHDQATVDQQ